MNGLEVTDPPHLLQQWNGIALELPPDSSQKALWWHIYARDSYRRTLNAYHGRVKDPAAEKQCEIGKEPKHLDGHSSLRRSA